MNVSEALAGQHITAEGVLAILENVAKTLNIPLPSAIGFDPAVDRSSTDLQGSGRSHLGGWRPRSEAHFNACRRREWFEIQNRRPTRRLLISVDTRLGAAVGRQAFDSKVVINRQRH